MPPTPDTNQEDRNPGNDPPDRIDDDAPDTPPTEPPPVPVSEPPPPPDDTRGPYIVG